jgi:hypothetical protein
MQRKYAGDLIAVSVAAMAILMSLVTAAPANAATKGDSKTDPSFTLITRCWMYAHAPTTMSGYKLEFAGTFECNRRTTYRAYVQPQYHTSGKYGTWRNYGQAKEKYHNSADAPSDYVSRTLQCRKVGATKRPWRDVVSMRYKGRFGRWYTKSWIASSSRDIRCQ